jgi:hypothetical protein
MQILDNDNNSIGIASYVENGSVVWQKTGCLIGCFDIRRGFPVCVFDIEIPGLQSLLRVGMFFPEFA